MSRPKLLDLYCCEGGAARGYDQAGFDVYGVDLFTTIKGGFSRKRYPYPAVTGDVIDVLRELVQGYPWVQFDNGEWLRLTDFAAVHASPPCQHASAGTRSMRSKGDSRHPALIEPTRDLLVKATVENPGLPWVIENVKGAALRDPVTLCGTAFALTAIDDDGTPLEMWRHRLFESNVANERQGRLPARELLRAGRRLLRRRSAGQGRGSSRPPRRLRPQQGGAAVPARRGLDDRARDVPVPAPGLHRVGGSVPPGSRPSEEGGGVTAAAYATDLNLAFYEASDWFLDARDMQGVDLMANASRKVAAEGQELADDESLDEWADVFIALIGVAGKHAWTAGDLARAVRRKVEVNRHRTWVEQSDGTFQHIAAGQPVIPARNEATR